MRNTFAVAWAFLVHDRRRRIAASMAMAAGVAMVVATLLLSSAASSSVREGIDGLGGVGDVAVVPRVGGAPISPESAAAIGELPGVAFAVESYSEDASIVPVRRPDDALDVTVTGVSGDVSSRLGNLLSSGRWPLHDDEVTLPSELADDLDVVLGDRVRLSGDVRTAFTIVGVADTAKLGIFADGNVFVTTPGAWAVDGVVDQYTRVDLSLAGDDLAGWADEVRDSLPDGTVVQNTSAVTDALSPVARATTGLVVAAGVVAVVLATLLAGTAGGDLARSRSRSTSVLAATGASPRWILMTRAVEGALAGAFASVFGAAIGVLIALTITLPGGQRIGVVDALAATAVAALVAAGLSAIASTLSGDGARSRRRGWMVFGPLGAALVLLGAVGIGTDGLAATFARFIATLAGGALLAMTIRPFVVTALRTLSWRAAGLDPRAGSAVACVTALVLVFGTALTSAAIGVSAATATQITRQFGADVQVTATGPLPDRIRTQVAALPQVGELAVSSAATSAVDLRDGRLEVPVLAVGSNWFEVEDLAWTDDRAEDAEHAISSGDGVAIPRSLAERRDIAVGDRLALEYEGRAAHGAVVGSFTSLATGDQIIVGPDTARALDLPDADGWDIRAAKGTDVLALRDRVSSIVEDVPGAAVITASDMRTRAVQQLLATFLGVFVLVAIAVALGAVGTAGTYRALVDRRKTELAVLRAIGARRRDLRAIVGFEWLAAVCSAIVPGSVAGLVASDVVRDLTGTMLGVVVPESSTSLTGLAVAALVIASMGVACLGSARRAATVPPSIALQEP